MKQPRLTAGGVTVDITHNGTTANIRPFETGEDWATNAGKAHTAPTGWAAATKNDSPPTERFLAVTDINAQGDPDYLAYGYWSKIAPASLASSDFQSFFYGNKLYQGNLAAQSLQGMTATYTGGASGVYNIRGTSDYGHFDANFQLQASFGPGARVTGSLTGISHLAGDPAFTFRNIEAPGSISGNGFTGQGGFGGTWGGRFFGPSGALPTGVAGWIEELTAGETGSSRTAVLSGSFGAKR